MSTFLMVVCIAAAFGGVGLLVTTFYALAMFHANKRREVPQELDTSKSEL